MKREIFTAWVTRHALTEGIKVVEAELISDISDNMITYDSGAGKQYAHGNDWHRTSEAAMARAEEMRRTKIASLRKSLERFERLTFAVPNAELRGERSESERAPSSASDEG